MGVSPGSNTRMFAQQHLHSPAPGENAQARHDAQESACDVGSVSECVVKMSNVLLEPL